MHTIVLIFLIEISTKFYYTMVVCTTPIMIVIEDFTVVKVNTGATCQ